MDSGDSTVNCAKCSVILDVAPDEPAAKRTPCPFCGSTARQFDEEIALSAVARDSWGMKARHGKTGRPFFEAKTGADLHRKSGKWLRRDLVIDRDNDLYIERVIDPKTGDVVHECEEPLSQHQGHGTAKHKPQKRGG